MEFQSNFGNFIATNCGLFLYQIFHFPFRSFKFTENWSVIILDQMTKKIKDTIRIRAF